MPNTPPSILPLPPEVAAQIRSSTTIPSLSTVVLGLLANSLDADASRINISVDLRRGAASVEDDGNGIPPKEFGEHGGLGKPYREVDILPFAVVWLISCRYIEIRQLPRHPWEERNISELCSRFVHPEHHLPSPGLSTTCNTHPASLQAGRKTDTCAFTSASNQS